MTTCQIKHKYKKIKFQKLETIYENNDSKDVGTSTDKQLKDYKIFVFDLDNTLFLHKVNSIKRQNYNRKLKNFLYYLKDNDKLLYIATHNFDPEPLLYKIDISSSLFNGIIKETRDLHPGLNTIEEYTNKKDMILEILNIHKNLSSKDVVFFDDYIYNIKQVESINVKSIYVKDLQGINFSDIY